MPPPKPPGWPFKDSPNVACFTTMKVLREGRPILLVTHDEDDGAWQFLCGTTNKSKDGLLIGLGEAFDLDPTVGELFDLPPGWRAWREAPDAPWHRSKNIGNGGED